MSRPENLLTRLSLRCGYGMAATQRAEKVTKKTTAVTGRELARRELDALNGQRDALVSSCKRGFARVFGLATTDQRQYLPGLLEDPPRL